MDTEPAPNAPDAPTLLLTVTGADRPGVTTALLDALAGYEVEVVDVEQIVIRGRLVLGVLVTAGHDEAGLRAAVTGVCREFGLAADIAAGRGDNATRPAGRWHVTVLGYPLRPVALAALTATITARGGNIDRITRLSRYPVTSLQIDLSGAPDAAGLRAGLAAEASAREVDVAVHPAGLQRRGKRLVVMDVDSTLIQGEVIEMLAERAGAAAAVARVTDAAMRGDLDFEESLRTRVGLLAGLDAAAVGEVRHAVRLTPGARTLVRTLKRLDHEVGIVSGGFTQVTDALAADLGLDHAAANTLEIVDGRLTGRLVGPIIDRAGKAAALERFAHAAGVSLEQTVAIGDGANDLDMLNRSGLGVAFNAKPLVRRHADATVTVPHLDVILFLLGISREEIEAADARDDEIRAL